MAAPPRANLSGPFFQQHFLPLCLWVTFWSFSPYFKRFHCDYMCDGICDQGTLMLVRRVPEGLEDGLQFLTRNYFKTKVCTLFFRHNAIAHVIDYRGVYQLGKITFIRPGKPKNSCDSIYCHICFIVLVWNPTCVSEVCLCVCVCVCVCV